MDVLAAITPDWLGIGAFLVVALVVRSIKHTGLAVAAGLSVALLAGLIAGLMTS